MPALSRMDRAWVETAAAMPSGWHLDSLRCASNGLEPHNRSDRWVAVAAGPDGEELQAQNDDPVAALLALARLLRTLRGPMTG